MRPENSKLRLGLMLNSYSVSEWQVQVIQEVIKTNCATFELMIFNDNNQVEKSSAFRKLFSKNMLYHFFNRYFYKNSAEKLVDISQLNLTSNVIRCKTLRKGKFSEYFFPDDVEKIRSHQLDAILRFGFNVIKGEILQVTRLGVWSYHHGDEQHFRGGPPGFWEIYRNSPTSSMVLQRLTEKLDAGIIIEKRTYKTIFHSYREQKDKLLMANTDMVAKAVKLAHTDSLKIESHDKTLANHSIIHKFPTNTQFMRQAFKLFVNRLKFYSEKYLFSEQWGLGYYINADPFQLKTMPDQLYQHPSSAIFYADGFILKSAQGIKILAEKFDYRVGRGEIVSVDWNGVFSNEQPFFSSLAHHAFPFLFEHDGRQFFLPESADRGSLELFEFQDNALKKVADLLPFPAVDAVVHFQDGLFWIFCGHKDDYPNEKLFAFYSNELTGTYVPHQMNPVKVTPQGSRNAGGFYPLNHKLYRFGQKSVKHYGEGIEIFEVQKLSPFDYEEVKVGEINPAAIHPDWQGIHTISLSDHEVLIDFKTHRFSLSSFFWRLKR